MKERYLFFFGDSHTLGSGDPEALGWAGRVTAASAREGVPVTGYNLGVGGETSNEVAARFEPELSPRLPDREDGDPRAIFGVGANDTTIVDGAPRCPPQQSGANLEALLDRAEGLGIRSFVVGPAAIDDEEQNDRIEALSNEYAAICATRQVPFAAVAAALRASGIWRSELRAGDGAHPGSKGYAELAALVLDAGWAAWVSS